jgi:3-phenylpropionate/trans-cinnamate dioxygenase ferredoxin reductase subunit
MPETIVIVGAGHAGSELSTNLRQNGFDGRIVMVGDEPYLPYQRPPLSKGFLAGDANEGSLSLRPQAAYEKANVELVPGTRVTRIDRAGKSVELSDGSVLHYDRLALVTGSVPRRLVVPGAHPDSLSNVHYLRSLDDVAPMRASLEPGRRLVVIGGGYIGLEVASVAIKRGLHVTVIEIAPRVMARVTSPEISAFFEGVHREAGVDLRLGAEATRFEIDTEKSAVRAVVCRDASGESVVPADVVLVSIGVLPSTALAEAAGLEVDNGIVVDELTRTSDPCIVAAGDCTSHPNDFYGRRVRLESVPNAMEQARAAAATLAGKPKPYASVPWFWSDQYGLKLQTVGLSEGYERVLLRGSPAARSFSAFYMKGEHILAIDIVSRPKELVMSKRLVAERVIVDPARLTDESVPLQSLLSPAGA